MNDQNLMDAEYVEDLGVLNNGAEMNVEPMGFLKRIISVFTNPEAAIRDIERNPKILLPAILAIALTSLVMMMSFEALVNLQSKAMIDATLQNGGTVPLDGFKTLSTNMTYGIVGGTGFISMIGLAVAALITHGAAMLNSGEGSFKKIFSAMIHLYFINLLGSAIAGLIGLALSIDFFTFSPAVLLDASQIGTPLHTALTSLDVFNIWRIAVMITAFRIIEKVSVQKSAVIVILLTGLGILLQVGPALLQR